MYYYRDSNNIGFRYFISRRIQIVLYSDFKKGNTTINIMDQVTGNKHNLPDSTSFLLCLVAIGLLQLIPLLV